MEANAGKSLQMQILTNIFSRISLHCKLVQSPGSNDYNVPSLPKLIVLTLLFGPTLIVGNQPQLRERVVKGVLCSFVYVFV